MEVLSRGKALLPHFWICHIRLQAFHIWLNNRSPDITFSLARSSKNLAFLDVEVKTSPNGLITTLHTKPMDKNNALHYRSYHPQNLKNNLPYAQFLCIRCNCAKREDFELHAESLVKKLKERGCPHKLLKHSLKRAWLTPREHLLTKKQKPPTDQIVCVSTFGPHTHPLKRINCNNWHLIEGAIPNIGPLIFALKKNRSIGQQIISSSATPKRTDTLCTMLNLQPTQGHHKCRTCSVCNSTVEGTLFTDGQRHWRHNDFTNCKSQNVYADVCPCKKIYIGKTTQGCDNGLSSTALG